MPLLVGATCATGGGLVILEHQSDERTYKLHGWMWSLVGEGLSLGLAVS